RGRAIDLASLDLQGTFTIDRYGFIIPDVSVGRAFSLTTTDLFHYSISAFDISNYTLLGSIPVPGLGAYASPTGMVRAGSDGLAITTDSSAIFVMHTPLVNGPIDPTPIPLPTSAGPNATHLGLQVNDIQYDPVSN